MKGIACVMGVGGKMSDKVGDFGRFIEMRKKYFTELLKLSPDFSVWSEEKNWLGWVPITQLDLNIHVIPNILIHREILPCEWVFDIDGEDWQSVRNLAVNLEDVLNKYGITFNRWSSGRWLHYHVFADGRKISDYAPPWYKKLIYYHFFKLLNKEEFTISELATLSLEIHKAIPLVILGDVKYVERAHIDLNKFMASRCLIRMEGSKNLKTNAFKSYLPELPEEQPLVKVSWHVSFPENLVLWSPNPKNYFDLFILAYWDYVRNKYALPQIKNSEVSSKSRKIFWIEKLLETPIPDGRKRAINLIFAPYFINILGLDEETALSKIFNWLEGCNKLYPTRITHNYVLNQLRYSRRNNLKPLSRKGVARWFADVPEVLSIAKISNKEVMGCENKT